MSGLPICVVFTREDVWEVVCTLDLLSLSRHFLFEGSLTAHYRSKTVSHFIDNYKSLVEVRRLDFVPDFLVWSAFFTFVFIFTLLWKRLNFKLIETSLGQKKCDFSLDNLVSPTCIYIFAVEYCMDFLIFFFLG